MGPTPSSSPSSCTNNEILAIPFQDPTNLFAAWSFPSSPERARGNDEFLSLPSHLLLHDLVANRGLSAPSNRDLLLSILDETITILNSEDFAPSLHEERQ